MSPASTDPAPPRFLFIVGSGRSGTTAYQSYLDGYPSLQTFPRLAAAKPSLTPLAGMLRRVPGAPERLVRPSGEAQRLLEEMGASTRRQQVLKRRLEAEDAAELDAARLERRADQLRATNKEAPTVLLKNTLNTARVEALARVFPDAVFHHVIRHPGRVIESLLAVDFFVGMTLWWDGRTVEQYAADEGLTREGVAARHWVRQVSDCLDGLASVPESRKSTVKYDEFTQRPDRVTSRALQAVGISPGTDASPSMSIRAERTDPLRDETQLAVQRECAAALDRLGWTHDG